MLTKSLAVAALAALPALATPAVNVYWGQAGGSSDRLRNYCENSHFEYVTVGFINSSPEHDPSNQGYPGTNFALHCSDPATYENQYGQKSKLLKRCGQIAADIRFCQKKGKKVLLSIGGEYNKQTADYSISTRQKGIDFADWIWDAFGPKRLGSSVPRPFDDNYGNADVDGSPFVFDGFDLDIEQKFGEYPLPAPDA